MRIVFISNYFNHHQKPFCEEMYNRLGDDFTFISTITMRDERKQLGYAQDLKPAYVLLAYEGDENKLLAESLLMNADVVIAGSVAQEWLKARIKAGKLIFRYAERPFKKKISFPKKLYHTLKHHKNNFPQKNIYMLCASAYTAKDYYSMGMYKGRTYRWGYFPEVKEYDLPSLMNKKNRHTLMWCGRFLDWKHPDDAIFVARKLKADGYRFRLKFVGTGDMEEKLKNMVEENDLSDCVIFLGPMKPEQVREHMEEAGIYLFTSDYREGWGAVLNESMNSGCAVVASHAIGSVPFLLKDGQNGYVYQSNDRNMLYEKVKYLLENPEEQIRLGKEAYKTMSTKWNAHIATERLLELLRSIMEGEKIPDIFEEGPCSKASVISDKWSE